MLLGDVGERQKVRERAGDSQPRRDRHLAKQTVERLEIAVCRACALGCFAHTLDAREHLVALVMAQHATQQLAEQSHVVAQRLMRIAFHFRDPMLERVATD
jgi:hypothetical protein